MEQDPLAETRARIAAMEALLEELPGLFERKFRQRLQPLLDQQQRLLNDNADLRQQLLLLQGSTPQQRLMRLLPLGRNRQGSRRLNPGDDGPPTAASADPTHR
jgi:hypothetical protein